MLANDLVKTYRAGSWVVSIISYTSVILGFYMDLLLGLWIKLMLIR